MENYTPKTFFERPEGKTGMFFIVVGVFIFLVAGNTIMPYIITALQNTIHAAILGGVVLGTIWLLMNKKFRLLCWNLYKSSMRFITSMMVTIDPIGIMKNYIEYMVEKLEDMDTQIGILGGQRNKLKQTIAERKKIAEQCADLARQAQKMNRQDEFTIHSRKMVRAKEFVESLNETLEKMDFMYRILDKMKKNVKLLLEDTKDEVETREVQYTTIKAANRAMSTAKRLIEGDEAKELFDQSMEFVADDIANKLAEMERAMEATKDFMDKSDLTNGIWDEKGLKILEDLDKGGSLFSYENTKTSDRGLSSNYSSSNYLPKTSSGTSVQMGTNFQNFFKKPDMVEVKSEYNQK